MDFVFFVFIFICGLSFIIIILLFISCWVCVIIKLILFWKGSIFILFNNLFWIIFVIIYFIIVFLFYKGFGKMGLFVWIGFVIVCVNF